MNIQTRCLLLANSLALVGILAVVAPLQGADAPAPGPQSGQPWIAPLSANTTLAMVWIPPGTFTMGSPESEPERKTDENQTQVTLTKGYWLGKTEVTIGEWKALTGRSLREQAALSRAGALANDDDDLPMYMISWNDAMEFCQKLTVQERAAGRIPAGYEYTLPTEAQWEYACRAGTTTATYAGPADADVIDKIAWYTPNAGIGYTGAGFLPTNGSDRITRGPRQVAVKQPNAWGLYDMAGNIWEWCYDYYSPSLPGGSVTDPTGPTTAYTGPANAALPGTTVRDGRVNRGGSFGSDANRERSACRASNMQSETSGYRGFRLALAPVLPPTNIVPRPVPVPTPTRAELLNINAGLKALLIKTDPTVQTIFDQYQDFNPIPVPPAAPGQ